MNNKPDYSEYGYNIIQELGRNREGGRITWLASSIATNQQVVIKQYSFAQTNSDWPGFNAHQREIEILQALNNPRIPKYLGAFPASNGFCLVQEYINAYSLAMRRTFAEEEIKDIAIQLLEILIYLQNRIPCIIHRDIKPENILVDAELNVYLIDFGFARIGSQEVSSSSVFVGTPGFIPPEQLLKPTKATDLFALGVTLICLLTGTKSTEIYKLIDDNDPTNIQYQHLLPQLSIRFLDWLEIMIQPKLKDRFDNAQQALDVLKPLDVTRCPQAEFSNLQVFNPTCLGEKIYQSITINNIIPDTLLEGRWEVVYHPNDPLNKQNSHPWIRITPMSFVSNNTKCEIEIDTSKLMADRLYKRQLLLCINGYPKVHTLTMQVQTAPIPIEKQKLSYTSLIWAFITGEIATLTVTKIIPLIFALNQITFRYALNTHNSVLIALITSFVMIILYAIISTVIIGIHHLFKRNQAKSNSNFYPIKYWQDIAEPTLDIGFKFAIPTIIIVSSYVANFNRNQANNLLEVILNSIEISINSSIATVTVGLIIVCINSFIVWLLLKIINNWSSLFAGVFGASFGFGFIGGFLNQSTILAIGITGTPLLYTLLYQPIKHQKLIAKYRDSEQNLIKP